MQGCMKSGQVLTDRRYKWFEPEYWRFGEAAGAEGQINYMRHASGQIYGLSGPVAKYIGRNGPILHRFANEDVTLGAWLVGLEITHVDERRLCCDSAEKCNAQVKSHLSLPAMEVACCVWRHKFCVAMVAVAQKSRLAIPESKVQHIRLSELSVSNTVSSQQVCSKARNWYCKVKGQRPVAHSPRPHGACDS